MDSSTPAQQKPNSYDYVYEKTIRFFYLKANQMRQKSILKQNQLKEYAALYIRYLEKDGDFAPGTIKLRKTVLNELLKFAQKRKITNLSEKLLQDFISLKKKEKRSPNTIVSYIRELRVFCNFLLKKGLISENFAKNIKKPRLPSNDLKYFSLEEVQKILNAKTKYKYKILNKTYPLYLKLISQTGMRRNEGRMLDVKDFDFNENTIHIRFAKGGQSRLVPLPENLKEDFKNWFKQRRAQPNNPVFIGRHNKRLNGEAFRLDFAERKKLVGIDKKFTGIHGLRHFCASTLLNNGVPDSIVSKLLGHKKITTTLNTYSHCKISELQEAVNNNHPLSKESKTETQTEMEPYAWNISKSPYVY